MRVCDRCKEREAQEYSLVRAQFVPVQVKEDSYYFDLCEPCRQWLLGQVRAEDE